MHEVDRLAEIRRLIPLLRQEAAQIRINILSGRCGTIGDNYVAAINRRLLLQRRAKADVTTET